MKMPLSAGQTLELLMTKLTMTRRFALCYLSEDPNRMLAAAQPLMNPRNNTAIEFWLALRWSLGIVCNEERLQPEA